MSRRQQVESKEEMNSRDRVERKKQVQKKTVQDSGGGRQGGGPFSQGTAAQHWTLCRQVEPEPHVIGQF